LLGVGDRAGELGPLREGAEADELVVCFDSATPEGFPFPWAVAAEGLDPGNTTEISGALAAEDFASVVVLEVESTGFLMELFEPAIPEFALTEDASAAFGGSGVADPMTGLAPLTVGGVKLAGGKLDRIGFTVAVAFIGAVADCPLAFGVAAPVEEL
jgi:hypothetical protein